MADFIPVPEPEPEPPAAVKARAALRAINDEFGRRGSEHRVHFAWCWDGPDYTPEEFFEALGTRAQTYLAVAAENVEHMARLASLLGKTLADLGLPDEHWRPRREFIFHADGTVTLAPEA